MQQFEIKIFANPSGFQELKLNNSDSLFTKEIIEKRNFDGDYGTFKDGTFSVLFTPKAFVIDYIFNVVADAGFRDPQTHIAIAIERGYILKDAYQVFTNLRKEFNLIAAEYKVNIARSLYNKSDIFNKIVEDNLEFAPDQFRISTSEIDVTKRALASYETEEQLNSLLEEPNRPKFRSYSLVYFLKKIDASELYKKESIKKYYSGIVMDDSDFNFHASYEVIFPDNHCITITSRSEVIDYTCNKIYYKRERFYGTLNDHLQDWEVIQSEDRTKFIVRKKLTPETKELQIVCYDVQKNQIPTPNYLEFTVGVFSAQKSVLLLTGEEIGKPFNCVSKDKRVKPQPIGSKGDVIYITLVRIYIYDVSAVFNYVSKTLKESISEIKIYQKGQRSPLVVLTNDEHSWSSELTPNKLEYEIPETQKYYLARGEFGTECQPLQPPKIQKKDTVDVELIIKDEAIVRTLNQKAVTCYYKIANDKKQEDGYPHSSDFDEDGYLLIKELPLGEFSCKIKIKGFKEERIDLPLYQKDKIKKIELTFHRTPWNKAMNILNKYKGRAAIFVIGLALGGFLRPYVIKDKGATLNPEHEQDLTQKQTELDSLYSILDSLKLDTISYKQKITELNNTIEELEAKNSSKKAGIVEATKIAGGYEGQQPASHPKIIKKILQMPNREKPKIKTKGTFQKGLYDKLSSSEKGQMNKILDDKILWDAFQTIVIPANVNTVNEAINYLNQKTGN